MDDSALWTAIDHHRATLADFLEELPSQDWNRPSLCEGWTVREVAAHLTLPAMPFPRLMLMFLRYPGSTNRTIRDGSKAVARSLSNQEIVAGLRAMDGLRHHIVGMGVREALIDIVGHIQDITLPLNRELPIEPALIVEVADHVLSYHGRGNAKVFVQLPLGTVRLVATDTDWATGSGPEVHGSMRDLFLVLIGRTVHLDQLSGTGASAVQHAVATA